MEGTLARTKKYLQYFHKSFWNDKVAISFLILIILTIIAIIAVAIMPSKEERNRKQSVLFLN
jgi:hypothetical protein